jgi:hypothetical protein
LRLPHHCLDEPRRLPALLRHGGKPLNATSRTVIQIDRKLAMPQYPQIGVRVDEEFIERLDAWRRQQPDLPTRPEALRRLADRGLAAEKAAGKSKRARKPKAE